MNYKSKHFTVNDGEILKMIFYTRYTTNEHLTQALYSPKTASYCRSRLSFLTHSEPSWLQMRERLVNQVGIYFLSAKGRHYIEDELVLERKYVASVSGKPGTGEEPYLFMKHDLTLTSLYVIAYNVAWNFGWTLSWANDQMLAREDIGMQPDARLTLTNQNGKSKTAYIEFSIRRSLKDKLAGYQKLLKDEKVLWFVTSRADFKLIQKIMPPQLMGKILLAYIEDKLDFPIRPIWWVGEQQVCWIRPESQRVDLPVVER